MNELDRLKPNTVRVLLVSTHDWFTSALQAVLEPEGFVFAHVRSARHALRHVEQVQPDIVILSESLPDLDAAGLVRTLRSGGLRSAVPVLVYSPNFWHEAEQARAMAAGAWDIIREPVRPAIIVAKLRRLLEIGRLIQTAEEVPDLVEDAGIRSLASQAGTIRRIEQTAHRNAVPLSCVVLGPGSPASGDDLESQRRATATMCSEHLRGSDLFGWVGDADFGVVAYNTNTAGVVSMVRRLNDVVAELDTEVVLRPLSAGVIELPVDHSPPTQGRREKPGAPQIASLSRLAAAKAALYEARAGGGGIRIGRPA